MMFIDIISRVFSVIEVVSVRGLEKEVFELASRENLTVYDAAYMYIATKNGLVLVTDDEKLKRRASRYTKVMSSSELFSTYHR